METRASYVLIGAFTLATLGLVMLFVLWLGKLQLDREWDHYDVVFNEVVTGLSVGGAVQYNGVQIGEVRRLSLGKDDPNEVVVRVRITGGTPVKTDTKAKLTLTGLTGVSVIQLFGGTAATDLLHKRGDGEVPRILATESSLHHLITSSEDIVTGVNDLLRRLSELLKPQNIDKIAATIGHLEQVMATTAAHRDEIGRAIVDISAASRTLLDTLGRTETLVTRLDTLASNSNAMLDGEGRALLASARESLDSARHLADNVSSLVAENREAFASLSSQGMAQAGPALADLRATLRKLQRLTDELERNPSAILSGKDKPVEYAPR